MQAHVTEPLAEAGLRFGPYVRWQRGSAAQAGSDGVRHRWGAAARCGVRGEQAQQHLVSAGLLKAHQQAGHSTFARPRLGGRRWFGDPRLRRRGTPPLRIHRNLYTS